MLNIQLLTSQLGINESKIEKFTNLIAMLRPLKHVQYREV